MTAVQGGGASEYTRDEVLVAALRRGDETAFGWLLKHYDASLRRLARQYVATPAVADEVVQETWLAVITGIDRFEKRSSVKTWLFRILMNVARSRGVKEHRSIPFSSAIDALEEGTEPAVPPERFQSRTESHPGHWASPRRHGTRHPRSGCSRPRRCQPLRRRSTICRPRSPR